MLVNSVQATLSVRLGGKAVGTGYDRLAVSGSVIPAGTLSVTLVNGFAPSIGDTFAVLTYASRDGSFGTVTLPAAAGGVGLVADYTPTALVLRAVASPLASPITLDIAGPNLIGLALTNLLTITLGAPAGAGGVTATITSDAAGVVARRPRAWSSPPAVPRSRSSCRAWRPGAPPSGPRPRGTPTACSR